MKLIIDTANVEHIKEMADLGIISGVTTNPTLIAKEGRDFKEVINEITSIVTAKAKAASEKTSIRVIASPRSLYPPFVGSVDSLSSVHFMRRSV